VNASVPALFLAVLVSAAPAAAAQGLPPSAGTDPSQIDVDVNSKSYIVLRTPAPRDWNNLTVEINETWRFTFTGVPQMSSVCINAAAFVMRGGGPALYFSPSVMNAKTVSVRAADGKVVPLHSVSIGMVKSLTPQQAAGCLKTTKGTNAR
jgi:hypothetical protein